MTTWRTLAAVLLLTAGVACVAGSTTDPIWWSVAGYIMLAFVPGLIIDEARRKP